MLGITHKTEINTSADTVDMLESRGHTNITYQVIAVVLTMEKNIKVLYPELTGTG